MSAGETASGSDNFIFYLLLAFVVWIPLPYGSNIPLAWNILQLWVYLMSIAWLGLFIIKRVQLSQVFLRSMPVIFIFCAWLVYITLQIIPLPESLLAFLSPTAWQMQSAVPDHASWMTISVDPYATREGLLKSIAYLLLFCLCLLLVNRRKRLYLLASTLVMSGLFQAIYASILSLPGTVDLSLLLEKKSITSVATGTFINRNHLAGYLVMCLATGIGLMIASLDTNVYDNWKQRLLKWLKLIVSRKIRLRLYLVIMVIALVLTRSRMGNLSFFISLLSTGVLSLLLSRHATRAIIIFITSLIIIDVLIISSWFGLQKVAERLESTNLVTDQRVDLVPDVLNYWSDYKLTGSGLGSFRAVFPRYRDSSITSFYEHAHNDYLEFLVETGVIGGALLGVAMLYTLGIAIMAQFRRHDPLMRGLSFTAIMSITAMLIHASVDFNLQIPANAATFMIMLAFAWISYGLQLKNRHHPATTSG